VPPRGGSRAPAAPRQPLQARDARPPTLTEPAAGWNQLLPPGPWYRRPGSYPIPAYSEFMPAPRLGRRAYGGCDPVLFAAGDPWAWHLTEYEEDFELRPGLLHLAGELLRALERLGRREPGHGIGQLKLRRNPYWPEPLASRGAPPHERYVALLPLALSRTQDDKGRVRWTLFGASEQGPARPFWRGYFTAPGREAGAAAGLAFCRQLIAAAGAASAAGTAPIGAGAHEGQESLAAATRDLLAAGFRIDGESYGELPDDRLPEWTAPLRWTEQQPLAGVRFLLSYRPFERLAAAVRQAYLASELHLLPFPGSLVFWGAQPYQALAAELPLALQIPLLHPVERSESPQRLRVPQSGWLHEPHPGQPSVPHEHGPVRNTFRRTHRWARVDRFDDELAVGGHEDRIARVLFSAAADDLGLYGKPMARNVQLWTHDYRLLLDGPRAGRAELAAAHARLAGGGAFGYRFLYPAMRVGDHEVFWHRPLATFPDSTSGGRPALVAGAPLGYLTAYHVERRDLANPVELWPRLLDRAAHRAAIEAPRGRSFAAMPDPAPPEDAGLTAGGPGAADTAHTVDAEPLAPAVPGQPAAAHPVHAADVAGYRRTVNNARKILEARQLLGAPLAPSFARALLRLPKHTTLAAWLDWLDDPGAPALAAELRGAVDLGQAGEGEDGNPADAADAGDAAPLTFRRTARRRFEEAYWRRIAFLAEGRFVNKDNADCVRDPVTRAHLVHHDRDLDQLADYLLAYYRRLLARSGAPGGAQVGDLPFLWQTDFEYSWSGGWLGNQQGHLEERNVMLAIPGRDRSRAVIMADHYDTAYMEDRYGYQHGGHGPRLAAAGADDNHSATAALMLAAPVFLEMSREGSLGCDVWLVHLTGEEFPSDCLGARHLAQALVEGTLRLRSRAPGPAPSLSLAPAPALANTAGAAAAAETWTDLSATRVQGVYVLDMVAHNNDRRRDVFQICPGAGTESMWLALQAHLANRAWNRQAPDWNRRARAGARRGRRSADGRTLPAMALHPQLAGEVRPQIDPHSTLYNTDGQIFSDAGVPVVLFMENYDINRHGYHDSHDTMENIDLDYGAAVAAIAIEAVARAATEPPPA
jgi:hypothetical protein